MEGEVYSETSESRLVCFYVMFLFLWKALFKLSDAGVQILLSFIAALFSTVAKLLHLDKLSDFASKLPNTIFLAKKVLKQNDTFQQYTVCPKCSAIYKINECIETLADKTQISKKCVHIEFPNHPMPRFRQPCDTGLMKRVKCSGARESTILYPRSVYCYQSLIQSLQFLLNRCDFLEKCEKWKSLEVIDGVYKDIYDGNIWKEFQNFNGLPFLSVPYNFGFILNVDWFQPYRHTRYSLGAMYIALLNLPRHERYLQENIILLGIIPGPHAYEPKKHINTFLRPVVEELKQLWNGVMLYDSQGMPSVIVKGTGALLCIACDVPAARKVSGFVGPMALRGCSKCLLPFPTEKFGDKADYSNFNRLEWEPRNAEQHHRVASAYCLAKTASEREKLERDYGIRYSVLNELPYFDASRMTVIDPMHNLLLGSAKYVVSIWKEQGIINHNNFLDIQLLVDSFVAPVDIGRIPLKIASGFSDFTADQWRNWIVYYSLISLKPVLPFRLYNHWHLFVKACHLLCQRTINKQQLEEADQLLIKYCEMYVELYGKENCTPNLHLHGHLASCIRDYGSSVCILALQL